MTEIIFSIVALVISVFSLALSFIQSRDKSFNIYHVQTKPLKDAFDLLFSDNNRFSVDLINFNNRDMLIYLCDGYVYIDDRRYQVKKEYYTIKANSVTKIEVEIFVGELYPSTKMNYNKLLVFEYRGLIFKRTYRFKGDVI